MASNVHKGGMVAAAFLPAAGGSFWAGLGMSWYLVFDLALNGAMAWLVLRQRGPDEGTLADLAAIERA